MTIADGQPILADDLNTAFSDAAPAGLDPGGLSEGLDAQRDLSNGYVSFRFRVQNPALGIENKKTFISPDDFDIYLIGVSVSTAPGSVSATQGPIEFTVKIDGSTGDFESDLPNPKHLFLMEPITNVDGKDHMVLNVQTFAITTSTFKSSRYVTYELNENRPCNTLLKGAEYDVTMVMVDNIYALTSTAGGLITDCSFEVFIYCKAKLRRN